VGASGWDYYVAYQPDLQAALNELRRHVFETGDYWWAVPYEFGKSAADFPNRPRTEAERRTVDGEMSTTTPASIASHANSKLDQRDSGIPRVAGSSHAIAVTWARCTALKRRGRPGRRASASPASRPRA
jgi:hypothetical protein